MEKFHSAEKVEKDF